MPLCVIVGEVGERWGNNRIVRMVRSQDSKRFLQLMYLRSQLICRVDRRRLKSRSE